MQQNGLISNKSDIYQHLIEIRNLLTYFYIIDYLALEIEGL